MWSVCRCRWRNFYPRPPRGGRQLPAGTFEDVDEFLSTPSARRATQDCILRPLCSAKRFLSTPSARRATAYAMIYNEWFRDISIHALREEGDQWATRIELEAKISIHALREEGDLPRLSAKWIQEDFYPRPPRGGRLPVFPEQTAGYKISIHALREEGDGECCRNGAYQLCISIHALREEGDRQQQPRAGRGQGISIHALREEGDVVRIQ